MKTNYENMNMLDMIFEHRNKTYGAYVLRNDYNRRASRALLICFSSLLVLLIGKYASDAIVAPRSANIFTEGLHELTDPIQLIEKPIELPKPKPATPNTSQAIEAQRDVEMAVVENYKAQDTLVPTDQLHDTEASITTNLNGNTVGVTDGKGDKPTFDPVPEPATAAFVLVPEVFPVFPGGDKKLMDFLVRNTRYPDYERNAEIEGKVVVRFLVSEDGSITSPEILKSTTQGFSKEALRVVALLPKFTPGMQHGRPVKVPFVLPFTFSLNN